MKYCRMLVACEYLPVLVRVLQRMAVTNAITPDFTSPIKGYVDDPRNTDNAWMETVAVNFHDGTGSSVGRFPLTAGDDAGDVQWKDVDSRLKLYASHLSFIEKTARLLNAHWE